MKTTILTIIALATLGSASAIPGMHDMRDDPKPSPDQVLGGFYGVITNPNQIRPQFGTIVIDKEHPSEFGPCINMVEKTKDQDDIPRQTNTMRARTSVTCVFYEKPGCDKERIGNGDGQFGTHRKNNWRPYILERDPRTWTPVKLEKQAMSAHCKMNGKKD